eukprot:6192810-Pleurochrysis_carterae.AAC.3
MSYGYSAILRFLPRLHTFRSRALVDSHMLSFCTVLHNIAWFSLALVHLPHSAFCPTGAKCHSQTKCPFFVPPCSCLGRQSIAGAAAAAAATAAAAVSAARQDYSQGPQTAELYKAERWMLP